MTFPRPPRRTRILLTHGLVRFDSSGRRWARGAIFAVLAISLASTISRGHAGRIELWYQDTNLRIAGGIPGDLVERYEPGNLNQWASSRALMDTYYLRQSTFGQHLKGNAPLQRRMADAHNAHGTTLAFDCTEATWAHDRTGGATPNFSRTINELRELVQNGFVLSHIGLQSVLSKPLEDGRAYGLEPRILDVVEFMKQVRPHFPGVKIGIIDAMAAQGKPWESWFTQLRDAVEAAGQTLDFVHIDMPFSYPRNGTNGNSWASLVAHERFIRDTLSAEVGVIATDNVGGMDSSNQWREFVLDGVNKYLAAGGRPDALMLFSWYTYPTETYPDTLTPIPSVTATQLRVLRDVASLSLSFGNPRFSGWIAGYGLGAQNKAGDDPDGDNLANALENFFGTHPNEVSSGTLAIEAGEGSFTFSHPQTPTPADDVKGVYLWSTDMSSWHHNGVTDGLAASPTAWTFETAGDFEGWTTANMGSFAVVGGVLSGKPTNADPRITRLNLNFPGSDAPEVRVRMRVDATGSVPVDFFWGNSLDSGFISTRSLRVFYTGNGVFQDVVFPMTNTNVTGWNGETITSLRIDPVNGGAYTNKLVEVDSVSVLLPGDATRPATKVTFTTQPDTPIPGQTTVTANVSAAEPKKLFVRIQATVITP